MGGKPRKTISLLAAAVLGVGLAVVPGNIALADPTPEPEQPAVVGDPELGLNPDGVAPALDGPGSEGCWVRVYNPWLQGGGVVGTSAHTDCISYEPYVYTRGEVWRSRWYGWQKMDEDPRSDVWTDYVSSFPTWYCRYTTHNWQGRSYHRIQWYNGTYGSAYLYSTNAPRISC